MSEWGPWIEHDGGPRPVPRGTYCHVIFRSGREFIGPVGVGFNGTRISPDGKPWGEDDRVIRYRVRKPRGLTILEEILNDLPAPVGPKVDA